MKKADLALIILLALFNLGSAFGDFVLAPPIVESFARLGLPAFYMGYFGLMKVLGVLGLFSPLLLKKDLFREGAQWGFALYYIGATATHVMANDTANIAGAAVLAVVSVASLALFQRTRG